MDHLASLCRLRRLLEPPVPGDVVSIILALAYCCRGLVDWRLQALCPVMPDDSYPMAKIPPGWLPQPRPWAWWLRDSSHTYSISTVEILALRTRSPFRLRELGVLRPSIRQSRNPINLCPASEQIQIMANIA